MKDENLGKVAGVTVRSSWRGDSLLTGAFNNIADNIGSITVQHGVYTKSGHYIGTFLN